MYSLTRSKRFSTGAWCLLCLSACIAALSLAIIAGQVFNISRPAVDKQEHLIQSKDSKGAVASDSSECSRIGIRILQRGGNAVDAAVATEFCLGIDNMWVTGLGAGGFAVIQDPSTNDVECVDFRETAPAAAYRDMFKDDPSGSTVGGKASGVPGELRGLHYLFKRYGSLPWHELIQPAIDYGRRGFVVTDALAAAMAEVAGDDPARDLFVHDPAWAEDFAPNGTRLQSGQRMKRMKYSRLLENIAQHGPDVFYSGEIAAAATTTIRKAGGIMNTSDFSEYSVRTGPAISLPYHDVTLHSCRAPAGGSIALAALNILQQYDNVGELASINLTTHRFDEAFRFSYAKRTHLGDPLFNDHQIDYENQLLTESFAREIKNRIHDDHTLDISQYSDDHLLARNTHGTSHMSAADASGLAISLTSTLNLHFGSRVMDPEYGLILNNEMDDFSVPGVPNSFHFAPSSANFVKPKARPLSSMSPTIAQHRRSGRFFLTTGAAGGSRIITAVAQSLWRTLDLGMHPRDAVAAPRFHDQLLPNETVFEQSFPSGIVAYMQSLGHQTRFDGAGTDVHILRLLSNGTFEAAAEPRIIDSGGYAI